MKITVGPISLNLRLLLRLWLPAIVFIGLCTGLFVVFIAILPTIAQAAPRFLEGVWLLLFIIYIVSGVAFTRFIARLLRTSFGSEELRIQRRMAILSGVPFYAMSLLCLLAGIAVGLFFPDQLNAPTAFVGVAGCVGFALVSGGYLLLLRSFLDRSTAIAD